MWCRIGYWKTGLALQVDEEAFEWIRLTGPAPRATLLPDRRFALTGGRGGQALCKISPASVAKRPTGVYADAANVQIDRGQVPELTFPLFEIHELAIEYDYLLDALVTEPIGPDHELPWPSDRHRRVVRIMAGGYAMALDKARAEIAAANARIAA
jgi:hypothetical protein